MKLDLVGITEKKIRGMYPSLSFSYSNGTKKGEQRV